MHSITLDNNSDTSQEHRSDFWNLFNKLTGQAEPEKQLQGFGLHLDDGSRWWLAGFPPAARWVEKAAPILHLRPEKPDGANIMVFFEGEVPPERVRELATPDSGWLIMTMGGVSVWHRMFSPDILIELKRPLPEVQVMHIVLQFVYRQSIQKGGLPFHAALVEHQGQGVLLSADSGVGKSTCSRRLSPPWQARCDDEALVTLAPNGRYLAHPFPTWSNFFWKRGEYSWNTQVSTPLAGIFFLEQSSIDKCLTLNPGEAAVEAAGSAQVGLTHLLRFVSPDTARTFRAALFMNACDLVKKVPAFRLQVRLSGRFWEKIEAALGGL